MKEKTTNLENFLNETTEQFTKRDSQTNLNTVLTNICEVIEDILNETKSAMDDKICAMEEMVDLPNMDVIDEFMVYLCGGYCLKNCTYGFPIHILNELVKCQEDPARMIQAPRVDDEQFIQVYLGLMIRLDRVGR